MKSVVVIPARFGSTRFPGKPLVVIAGITMLERVWNIAKTATKDSKSVFIATDDDRIESEAKRFGAQCIKTSSTCRNGSERVFEALQSISPTPEIVINLQGDCPIVPPWFLTALIEFMEREPSAAIATLAVPLSEAQLNEVLMTKHGSRGGTYVTFGQDKRALYFSRYPIPFTRSDIRTSGKLTVPVYKHIGIYGFRFAALKKYVYLEPTPLEVAEQLEQLRALEHGMPIHVVEVTTRGRTLCSVDTPEDAKEAENIIAREGELL